MSEGPRLDAHRRFQLARRVRRALEGVEGLTAIHIDDEIPKSAQPEGHGDFVIQALDLRVRIVLLVGSMPNTATVLTDPMSERVEAVLGASPDTDAVVLVFDDEALTSYVIEPFDILGEILAPSGRAGFRTTSEGPAPLAEVLTEYLRLLQINWTPWTAHTVTDPIDLRTLATEAADYAVAVAARQRYRVPEKQAARDTLDNRDSGWLANIVREAAAGELSSDLEQHLRERGEGP
jgi:hypothetical protein